MLRPILLVLAIPVLITPLERSAVPLVPSHVRFANHLTGTRTWSLRSNTVPVFRDVATNTTTGYVVLSDTTSKLTLHRESGDSVFASTNYNFVGGSYYTITASYGNSDRPMLAVERDVPPRDTMP